MATKPSAFVRHAILPLNLVSGGVNYLRPITHIEDDQSPDMQNFECIGGRLRVRGGMQPIPGDPAASNRITGLGLALFDTGLGALAIHTKDAFYTWDGATSTDRTPGGGVFATSSDTDFWSGATILNNYFFSNGVTDLNYWDGSRPTSSLVTAAGGYSGPAQLCGRYVCGFAGRIFIAYTTETSVHTQRVRWCGNTTPFNWDTTAGVGAGSVDLADTPGRITGMCVLGDQLFVFKEDAIYIGRETGDPTYPIVFATQLRVGCLAGQTGQAIDPNTVVFLGRDNVYMLSGGQTKSLGDRIVPKLFDPTDGINYSAARSILSWIDPFKSTYYISVPLGSQQYAHTTFCYNWLEDKWWIEDSTGAELTAVLPQPATFLSGTTWTAAAGTAWSGMTGTWSSLLGSSNRPRVYIAYTYGSTYRTASFQYGQQDDFVTASLEPIAFWLSKSTRPNPEGYSSLYKVVLTCSASVDTTLSVSVSTDEGSTFPSTTTVTIPFGSRQRINVDLRATGIYFLLRFLENNSTASNLQIHNIDLIVLPRRSIRV